MHRKYNMIRINFDCPVLKGTVGIRGGHSWPHAVNLVNRMYER
jgi:hypothetical protein